MTDQWLVFNSVLPAQWVLAAATLLTIVFVWMEWKKNSRFRLLRCFAQIMVTACSTLLILRPAIKTEFDGTHTILLTPGFKTKDLDSILRLHPSAELKRTKQTPRYRDVRDVSSLNDELHGTTYVLGDGISVADLDELHDKNFIYLPGAEPAGITSIISKDQPTANQSTPVHIQTNNKDKGTILIKSPGAMEDSASLPAGISLSTLNIRPKQAGRFLYSIIIKDQNGRVTDEQPLALDISPEEKLNFLFLQDYPTSEVRYLKNFLSTRGHGITLRYQLSKNVYRHEFANTPQKNVNRIDSETLNAFDIVCIDSDVLKKMSPSERKQLDASVRNGLGLLMLFNETPQQSKASDDLIGVSFSTTRSDTAFVSLKPGATTLVRTLASSVKPEPALTPVLHTSDKKILSGYRYRGIGKSGFNLLTETYRFIIEGNDDAYAALWAPLFRGLARKKQENFSIRVLTPGPVYVNEPVSFEVLAAAGKPSAIADSITVALTEDVLIDDRWTGKTWFSEPGWHTLSIAEDSTQRHVYVYGDNELAGARQFNQRKLNSTALPSAVAATAAPVVDDVPASPLWFFVVFLLASGFLWLSPKL